MWSLIQKITQSMTYVINLTIVHSNSDRPSMNDQELLLMIQSNTKMIINLNLIVMILNNKRNLIIHLIVIIL
jgi:hypothetical protein